MKGKKAKCGVLEYRDTLIDMTPVWFFIDYFINYYFSQTISYSVIIHPSVHPSIRLFVRRSFLEFVHFLFLSSFFLFAHLFQVVW